MYFHSVSFAQTKSHIVKVVGVAVSPCSAQYFWRHREVNVLPMTSYLNMFHLVQLLRNLRLRILLTHKSTLCNDNLIARLLNVLDLSFGKRRTYVKRIATARQATIPRRAVLQEKPWN